MDICNSVSTQLCKSVQKVSQLVLMYCEHATYGDRCVQNIYLEPPPPLVEINKISIVF